MTARLPFIAASFLAAGVALCPLPGLAQAQPGPAPLQLAPGAAPLILVVDIPLIMRESKVGKGVQQQLEQQQGAYSKELSGAEKDLNNAGAELKRQEQILAREAFEARAKELQQRAADLQRNADGKRETLRRADGTATNQVLQTMYTIINELVAERRASLVLIRQPQFVAYVDPSLDITQETLRRLDQRMPALAVSFNQPAPAATPAAAAPAAGQSTASTKGKPKSDATKKN
jgi:outer membrane protein